MIVQLHITGEMQFFFAGKNALTIALLLYRLYAVQCKRQEDEDMIERQLRSASEVFLGVGFLKRLEDSYKGDKEVDKNGNNRSLKKKGFSIKQLSFGSNA